MYSCQWEGVYHSKMKAFDSNKGDTLRPRQCDEGLTPTKDGGICLRRLSMFRKERREALHFRISIG